MSKKLPYVCSAVGRFVVFVCLAGSAILKMSDGFQPGYAVNIWVFYFAAVVELVGSGFLLTRRWRIGCLAAMGISLGGAVVTILAPTASCGCHGSLSPESWQMRIMISATLGAIASSLGAWGVGGEVERPAQTAAC